MTGTPVYPIDSELSAIFQCLRGNEMREVRQILLTASGGPFRRASLEEIQSATVEQALKHPNWSMGAKITIDCATMINKGLEVMETRWLFDIPAEKMCIRDSPNYESKRKKLQPTEGRAVNIRMTIAFFKKRGKNGCRGKRDMLQYPR